ncbi:hypothetical protein X777_03595 [Ooceraea biroi]|uniref:Uncharacterized protein n=1 Tax=Ooceraea biroi TaxID=2015173 RepID=A0A026WM03_OOCBI|nr:hypothetical protein X777_03595 [Ooceraea biroi]
MSVQLAAVNYIFLHYLLKKPRKSRRWWIKRIFANRGVYSGPKLLRDLKFQSVSGQYKNFTRMSPIEFEYLINLVGKQISKIDTTYRKVIPVQKRLAITLRSLDEATRLNRVRILRIGKRPH